MVLLKLNPPKPVQALAEKVSTTKLKPNPPKPVQKLKLNPPKPVRKLKLNPPEPVQALVERVSTTKLKLTHKAAEREASDKKVTKVKASKAETTKARIINLVVNNPLPKFDWDEVNWITSDEALATEPPLSPKSTRTFTMGGSVWEKEGNLLNTPPGSLLIHSCNCEGVWGKGVAGELANKFPAAFKIYEQYCKGNEDRWQDLLGTALLIPPQRADLYSGGTHWIACLFTKIERGHPQPPFGAADLHEATAMALKDLAKQMNDMGTRTFYGGIFAPRINAGIFGVPWTVTRQQIHESGISLTVLVRREDMNNGDVSKDPVVQSAHQAKTEAEAEAYMKMVGDQRRASQAQSFISGASAKESLDETTDDNEGSQKLSMAEEMMKTMKALNRGNTITKTSLRSGSRSPKGDNHVGARPTGVKKRRSATKKVIDLTGSP